MKIVVLAGGLSMERDVSLASGSLIANALRDNGEQAVLVDLYYGIKNWVSLWKCVSSFLMICRAVSAPASTWPA